MGATERRSNVCNENLGRYTAWENDAEYIIVHPYNFLQMSPEAKETIELLDGVFAVVDATENSLKDDGKIDLKDSPKYFGALLKLPAAIGGAQKVPTELSHLSEEGKQEVLDYFAERFDLNDDELEAYIEDALRTGAAFTASIVHLAKYKRAA